MDQNSYVIQVITKGFIPGTVVIRYQEDPLNLARLRDPQGLLGRHLELGWDTAQILIQGSRFDSCPTLISVQN